MREVIFVGLISCLIEVFVRSMFLRILFLGMLCICVWFVICFFINVVCMYFGLM